eukprot:13298818-Alexandrium_andersonii.AAC.1
MDSGRSRGPARSPARSQGVCEATQEGLENQAEMVKRGVSESFSPSARTPSSARRRAVSSRR